MAIQLLYATDDIVAINNTVAIYAIGGILFVSPIGDKKMRVGNARDIGQMIRTARLRAGMRRQSDLARAYGTTQGWLSELENGKPRAELDLVLRVLRELGFTLDFAQQTRDSQPTGHAEPFDAASLAGLPSSRTVMDQSDDENKNNGGR